MKEKGLIHIYCGDGKGKTTASVGLAIRCAGGGGKVLFYQFLKDGTSGEVSILKNIDNIKFIDGYKNVKFSSQMTAEEKEDMSVYYKEKLNAIKEKIEKEKYDMLILDEIIYAINLDYVALDDVVELLNNKPYGLEIVLTGRNPNEKLCEIADYISEINKIKHPFDKGIKARVFVEK